MMMSRIVFGLFDHSLSRLEILSGIDFYWCQVRVEHGGRYNRDSYTKHCIKQPAYAVSLHIDEKTWKNEKNAKNEEPYQKTRRMPPQVVIYFPRLVLTWFPLFSKWYAIQTVIDSINFIRIFCCSKYLFLKMVFYWVHCLFFYCWQGNEPIIYSNYKNNYEIIKKPL